MRTAHWLLAAVLFTSTFAHAADVLALKPGTNTVNGVSIPAGATATVGTQALDLTTVGSGLRAKQVIVMIPVYVAQLLVNDSSKFVKKDPASALASLNNETTVAIRMSFLRDVDAGTVETAYEDGLDANSISTTDVDVAKFLSLVQSNGDAQSGQAMTILITKNSDGTETLVYQNGSAASVSMTGAKGLTQKVMAIWLGSPADNGLANLQNDLLK